MIDDTRTDPADAQMVTCPYCDGYGAWVYQVAPRPEPPRTVTYACVPCSGKGLITATQAAAYRAEREA